MHEQKRISITGASGLVGRRLVRWLEGSGREVVPLVRRPTTAPNEVAWSVDGGVCGVEALEGVDAVVHLAGESIANGRWTAAKMRRIEESRVRGTRTLCESLAGLERKPEVLVSASAVGFYGDRGDELLDESAAPGSGFLADVCQAWEAACAPARHAGIRVVHLRIGVVLSSEGGALRKMLTPFKLGIGGKIGSGRQFMSWIELDDLVAAIDHVVVNRDLEGPVNATAPRAVTNAEFTRTLGAVLRRPTVAPLPRFAARLALGKMADELLLASIRVQPRELTASGFRFEHADLSDALRHQLRGPTAPIPATA